MWVSQHLFVLWLLLNVLLCTLLFKDGFLLSKRVVTQRSVCKARFVEDASNATYCGHRRFSRAIVLVVDALRFDFAVFDKHNAEPEHFENKLSIIHELEQGNRGKLFRFLAEPPTTTMQRLKGLTTGSLPTFIEASQNFGSSEIEEDNIIAQLKSHGRKVVFAGDDTWLELFNASSFSSSHPFPSFNVWDLDTVDNGVRDIFSRVLGISFNGVDNNMDEDPVEKDWHVLIGHYLGVDHAGHKYGPRHPEMARKLSEVNDDLEVIVKAIGDSNDTLLVVLGDHGMTDSGDHGGDSLPEVSSALFVYSPGFNFEASDIKSKDRPSVSHIDLVSTLSALLALPTPFSNVGKRIKLLIDDNDDEQVVYSNVEQVMNYLAVYRLTGGTLPDAPYFRLRAKFERLSDLRSVSNSTRVILLAEEILDEAKALCEATWAQFDLKLMSAGITLLFMLLVLLFCFLFVSEAINTIDFGFVLNLYFSMAIGSLMGLLYIFVKSSFEYNESVSILMLFATGISIVNFGLSSLWKTKRALHKAGLINHDNLVVSLTALAIIAISTISFFSNSLVVNEAAITQFALVSLIVIQSVIIMKRSSNTYCNKLIAISAALTCLCTKLGANFWRCREEQQGYCKQTDYFKSLNTLDKDEQYRNSRFALTTVSIVVFVLGHHIYMRKSGNNNGHGLVVTLNNTLPVFAAVATLFFWALQARESTLSLGKNEQSVLASFSLISSLLVVIVVTMKPSGLVCTEDENSNKAKTLLKNKTGVRGIAVSGLSTALSAPFLAIHCAFSIGFMLFLGDGLAASVLLTTFLQGLILMVATLSTNVTTTNSSLLSILTWQVAENLCFYTTSHQPIFASIPWSAAFVLGESTDFSSKNLFSLNFVLPLVFVVANIFYNRIIFDLMLPILTIIPHSLGHKLGLGARGEHYLMESHNRKALRAQVTKTICISVFVQALRLLASMMAAAVLRRHLMLWKIFAPRFIFEAVGFCVSSLALCGGHLFFERVYSDLTRLYSSLH